MKSIYLKLKDLEFEFTTNVKTLEEVIDELDSIDYVFGYTWNVENFREQVLNISEGW